MPSSSYSCAVVTDFHCLTESLDLAYTMLFYDSLNRLVENKDANSHWIGTIYNTAAYGTADVNAYGLYAIQKFDPNGNLTLVRDRD